MGVREDLFEAMGRPLNDRYYSVRFIANGIRMRLVFEKDSEAARRFEEGRGRWHQIGARYSARLDGPHTPHGQQHVHGYVRGIDLFALNKDGSTRHGSGIQIPSALAAGIRDLFPWIRIPPGDLLESIALPDVIGDETAMNG
jgi:hypothetical protein